MKKYWILMVIFFVGLIVSGIRPHDYFTWILEVFPAVLGLSVLMMTFRRFRFTMLVYILILIHSYILFVGGHFTYAEVPLFDWIKETLHQSRNNYDKMGHFAQGFVPAIIVRELFVRKHIIHNKGWLPFLILCVCVFISVLYEFLEWAVALMSKQSADAFLGTQGYEWDTQSDILFALLGSISMITLLSRYHDKQIIKIHGTDSQ